MTPDALGHLVMAVIRDHALPLTTGALITVDESTMRVRVLPIA